MNILPLVFASCGVAVANDTIRYRPDLILIPKRRRVNATMKVDVKKSIIMHGKRMAKSVGWKWKRSAFFRNGMDAYNNTCE